MHDVIRLFAGEQNSKFRLLRQTSHTTFDRCELVKIGMEAELESSYRVHANITRSGTKKTLITISTKGLSIRDTYANDIPVSFRLPFDRKTVFFYGSPSKRTIFRLHPIKYEKLGNDFKQCFIFEVTIVNIVISSITIR